MYPRRQDYEQPSYHTCCPQGCSDRVAQWGLSRRSFLEGVGSAAALGSMALAGLTWSTLAAEEAHLAPAPSRRRLRVKPIFTYQTSSPRPQTSWRPWGGVQTHQDAEQEATQIKAELAKLQGEADFPLELLPLAAVTNAGAVAGMADVAAADALLVYAAGGSLNPIQSLGKDTVFFVRHKSGSVYLHYEIISPIFLRQHTDRLAVEGIDELDVVVDSQEEILWRLRALCGLRGTMDSKILAVGGPGGWAQPPGLIPALAEDRWKLDIETISYDELGKLIQAAKQDKSAVTLAKERATAYVKTPGTTLETKQSYVENCFLLEQIFRSLMSKAGCRAITINGCMQTIMPLAETSACLTLSTLNDDGYLAFCESDFVVIPAGLLMCSIAGRPPFLNDPTYPHDSLITLAHCTAPRRMDGRTPEPARIVTHFESDYGAAPKVEMHNGQVVTNVVPDFAAERWLGVRGEIVDHPFLPICRSQIDVRFDCPSRLLAQRMPGFHWMTIYGDYLREIGYALKKTRIGWECLSPETG